MGVRSVAGKVVGNAKLRDAPALSDSVRPTRSSITGIITSHQLQRAAIPLVRLFAERDRDLVSLRRLEDSRVRGCSENRCVEPTTCPLTTTAQIGASAISAPLRSVDRLMLLNPPEFIIGMVRLINLAQIIRVLLKNCDVHVMLNPCARADAVTILWPLNDDDGGISSSIA